MKKLLVEIPVRLPAGRSWRRACEQEKMTTIREMRNYILKAHGEGPWKKADIRNERKLKQDEFTKLSRMISLKMQKEWPKSMPVFVDLIARRETQFFERDHLIGTAPVFEALKNSGWAVGIESNWLRVIRSQQVVGDEPLIVLEVFVPETDDEIRILERKL